MIRPFIVFVCEDSKQLLYCFNGAILQFMWKSALKMWRMRMLANYADLHHHILSDALIRVSTFYLSVESYSHLLWSE